MNEDQRAGRASETETDYERFFADKDKLDAKAAKKLFSPGDILDTKLGRVAVVSIKGRRLRVVPVYDIHWDGDQQTARVLEKQAMDNF